MAILRSGILLPQPWNPDSAERTPAPRNLRCRQRLCEPEDFLAHTAAEFRPVAPGKKAALRLATNTRRLETKIPLDKSACALTFLFTRNWGGFVWGMFIFLALASATACFPGPAARSRQTHSIFPCFRPFGRE